MRLVASLRCAFVLVGVLSCTVTAACPTKRPQLAANTTGAEEAVVIAVMDNLWQHGREGQNEVWEKVAQDCETACRLVNADFQDSPTHQAIVEDADVLLWEGNR